MTYRWNDVSTLDAMAAEPPKKAATGRPKPGVMIEVRVFRRHDKDRRGDVTRLILPLALLLAGCTTTIAPGDELVANPHCLAFCRVGGETLRASLAARLKRCPREASAEN